MPQSQRISTRMGGPAVQKARWSTNEHLTRRALILLLAFIALLAAGIAFRSCTQETEAPEPQPFYNHAAFARNGQFYEYVTETVTAHKTGVDVSDHQQWIDWSAVRKAGIQFAYIRIGYRGSTEGDMYQDDYFEYNMAGAKDAGIERGVYFFSQATTPAEGREEAQFVLDTLDGAKLDYPVAFDFEIAALGVDSRAADLNSEEASAVAQAFCETITAGGYDVILYGNGYDLARYSEELLARYPVWYAEYGALPAYTEEYVLWQYASEGHIDGIQTIVDLNLDLSPVLESLKEQS